MYRLELGVMLNRKFRVRDRPTRSMFDSKCSKCSKTQLYCNPQQCPPCLYRLFVSHLNNIGLVLLILIQYSDTAVMSPSIVISQLRLRGLSFLWGAANTCRPIFIVNHDASENDTPSILLRLESFRVYPCPQYIVWGIAPISDIISIYSSMC